MARDDRLFDPRLVPTRGVDPRRNYQGPRGGPRCSDRRRHERIAPRERDAEAVDGRLQPEVWPKSLVETGDRSCSSGLFSPAYKGDKRQDMNRSISGV